MRVGEVATNRGFVPETCQRALGWLRWKMSFPAGAPLTLVDAEVKPRQFLLREINRERSDVFAEPEAR